ncbi:MAG: sugar phosphate isomerase/epimerase family protein [Mahellales bacterium]
MKICFSTLGCPDWSWSEITSTAKDFGYDGIEVRGIGKELYVPRARPFHQNRIDKTKARLVDMGLKISCLTSSCLLGDKARNEQSYNEGKDYIDLAARLEVPYIRVLGDGRPQPSSAVDQDNVIYMLKRLGDYAEGKGVTVLIETNGIYAESRVMEALMKDVDHSNVAVLWDIHHPFRFYGEPVEETHGRLKDYIKHVHLKDSVMGDNGLTYCMMGRGDVPIDKGIALLKKDGYSGYISLEWVKRWYISLEEPGIVYSYFIKYIKKIMEDS